MTADCDLTVHDDSADVGKASTILDVLALRHDEVRRVVINRHRRTSALRAQFCIVWACILASWSMWLVAGHVEQHPITQQGSVQLQQRPHQKGVSSCITKV